MSIFAKSFFCFICIRLALSQANSSCSANSAIGTQYVSTDQKLSLRTYKYFAGDNLQFKFIAQTQDVPISFISAIYQSLTATYNFPTLINFKVYRPYKKAFQNQFTILFSNNSKFYVQQYSYTDSFDFTPESDAILVTLETPQQQNITQSCYDIEYYTSSLLVVDCFNGFYNKLITISYRSNEVVSNATSTVLSTNNYSDRKILIMDYWQKKQSYLIRAVQGVNNSYIEIFRIVEQSSYILKFNSIPPINSISLQKGDTNFSIHNVQISNQYLIFYEEFSNTIFKVNLNRIAMSYNVIFYNSYLTDKILGISSYYDGKALKIVLAQSSSTKNYVAVYDWTYDFLTQFSISSPLSELNNVVKIAQSYKFVVMLYETNNPTYEAYMIIFRKHQQYGRQFPIIYQSARYTEKLLFQMDTLQNNLLMFFQNNTQQFLSYGEPMLEISSTVAAATSISIQIQCMGYLAEFSGTATTPTFTSQYSETIKINFYPINQIQIIEKKTIEAQSLTSNVPGQTILNLNKFFYGPALSYAIQDTTDSGFTKNSSASVFKTLNIYSNNTFKFPFGSGEIQLIKAFQMEENYYYWFVELANGKLYDYFQNQNTLEFEEIIQIEQQSFLTAKVLNYYFVAPYIQIFFPEQSNQCSVYFTNNQSSQPFFELKVCNGQSYKIQNIVLIKNQLFILADPQNTTDSTAGQILLMEITNSSFINSLSFSKIQKTLIKQSSFKTIQGGQTLTSFIPLNIIQNWKRPTIYFFQCVSQVLIVDLSCYHIYAILPLPAGITTQYQIGVTQHSLFIITSSQVIEYSIKNIENIILIRDKIPNYLTGLSSYSTSSNLIISTRDLLIIYETSAKQILIINEQQLFAFNVIRDIITLQNAPISLNPTFNSDQKVIQLNVFYQTQGIDIYQIYLEEFVALKGFVTKPVNDEQTFNFQIQTTSSFSSTQSASPIKCQIKMTQYNTTITLITSPSSNQLSSISVPQLSNNQDFYSFFFEKNNYFNGIVLNYYLQCEIADECNSTILMQGPIDKTSFLSNNTYFYALAKGNNNFTYAQSQNKIFRLGTSQNKFYDYAQLPFYNLYKVCMKLVAEKTDLYTISACTDFENPWTLYFASFISTEPHVFGQITIKEPQFIYKMILMNGQLFVIDANDDLSIFNGIHIYRINSVNFAEGFDSTTNALPNYFNYVTTFHFEQYGFTQPSSFDIHWYKTETNFRFVLTTSEGIINFIDYDSTSKDQYFTNQFSIEIIPMLKARDTEFNQKSKSFSPYLNGIKLFNYNQQYDQLEAILIFKFFHSYDVIFDFQSTSSTFTIIPQFKFFQYAFYESQNNVEVIDFKASTTQGENASYVLFSGYLPPYLSTQNNNYSQHILFAYNRIIDYSNQGGDNLFQPGFMELSPISGYSFKMKQQFTYQIQKYVGISSTNTSLTLISPDDQTFQNFCLNKNPSVLFTSDIVQSAWVTVYAQSLFSHSSYTFSVSSQHFSKKKDRKLWIIGVVLGSVALLAIAITMIIHFRRKVKNINVGLLEDN